MLRWLKKIRAMFAWVPVYFDTEVEVEQNVVTEQYRFRSIAIAENDIVVGKWQDGLPDPVSKPVSLDDLIRPSEMAKRLVPLWGEDDRRKADND